jgi:hypothetical protein
MNNLYANVNNFRVSEAELLLALCTSATDAQRGVFLNLHPLAPSAPRPEERGNWRDYLAGECGRVQVSLPSRKREIATDDFLGALSLRIRALGNGSYVQLQLGPVHWASGNRGTLLPR